MQQVILGRSGMRVAKIGFGGIPIQRLSESESTEVIRRAVELGIDWFDTANCYGDSEVKIGKGIRGFRRESLKIFSKSTAREAKEFLSHVKLSLEQMGLEYIDLYQFHAVSTIDDWHKIAGEGLLDAAIDLKSKGLIRHVGASSHRLKAILEVMDHPAIEVVQYPFNFIETDALEILKKCEEKNTGFIAMKPFGGGMLDDTSACVRFLMQYEGAAANPGFEKIAEIEEVVGLVEEALPLNERDYAVIERLKDRLGDYFCRRCGYCKPCEQGIDIVALMAIESIVKRVPLDKLLSGVFGKAAKTIDKCTECGECESRCPYGLSIRKRIRFGAELLLRMESEQKSS